MIYLDANVFIYAAGAGTAKGERAREVIQAVQSGKLQAASSVLTFDEVVWELRKQIGMESALIATQSFFLLPDLEIYNATRGIFLDALEIMRHEKMKPRDSIHMATMRNHGIHEILTEDPDFGNVRGIKRISLEKFRVPG
ncbi:MAG: type II toxin-antitoxin system VapC family toxin [Candidatus Aenigmarchaeota archaeon]|nr:type II toxin-antitoxin system VapC family toxin [Candidatus Aenigmarchaeota archaeon]